MEAPLWEQGLSNYFPAFLCLGTAGILLDPEESPVLIFIGILIVHIWVYLVHRGLHLIPDLFAPINTHITYHHESELKTLPRWLELTFEFGVDMAMVTSLWGVQWLIGISLVPTSMIFLFALAYSSVHLIQYSMIGSDIHRTHHETLVYNYSPDFVDHMFGTNYSTQLENTNMFIPNILGSLFVLWPFRQWFTATRDYSSTVGPLLSSPS